MAATELANRGDAPEAAALVLDDDDATAAVASPVGDAEANAAVSVRHQRKRPVAAPSAVVDDNAVDDIVTEQPGDTWRD